MGLFNWKKKGKLGSEEYQIEADSNDAICGVIAAALFADGYPGDQEFKLLLTFLDIKKGFDLLPKSIISKSQRLKSKPELLNRWVAEVPKESRLDIFEAALIGIMADNEITSKEKEFVEKLYRLLEIDEQIAKELVETTKKRFRQGIGDYLTSLLWAKNKASMFKEENQEEEPSKENDPFYGIIASALICDGMPKENEMRLIMEYLDYENSPETWEKIEKLFQEAIYERNSLEIWAEKIKPDQRKEVFTAALIAVMGDNDCSELEMDFIVKLSGLLLFEEEETLALIEEVRNR